jgi:hypothetical protein
MATLDNEVRMVQMRFNMTLEVSGDIMTAKVYLLQPDGTRASYDISSDIPYAMPSDLKGYTEFVMEAAKTLVPKVADVRGNS